MYIYVYICIGCLRRRRSHVPRAKQEGGRGRGKERDVRVCPLHAATSCVRERYSMHILLPVTMLAFSSIIYISKVHRVPDPPHPALKPCAWVSWMLPPANT